MSEQPSSSESIDLQNMALRKSVEEASHRVDTAAIAYKGIAETTNRSPWRNNPQPLSNLVEAVDDYKEAVDASKRFLQDNATELHDIASEEGMTREVYKEQVEREKAEQLAFAERGAVEKAAQEVAERALPYPKVDAAHDAKVAEVKKQHDDLANAYENHFGNPYSEEDAFFGSGDVDYMTDREIDVTQHKKLDEYTEAASAKIQNTEEDLAAYYHEHQATIQANAEVIMKNDLEDRADAARDRASRTGYRESRGGYADEAEEQ